MERIETEKVTVEVPKAMMDFLRAQRENIKKYLEYTIVSCFAADLDASAYNGPFNDNKQLIEKFNLEPVFKAFNHWPLPSAT